MIKRPNTPFALSAIAASLFAGAPYAALAQTPVDDGGQAISTYESATVESYEGQNVGNEEIPLLAAVDLEDLVGPIALYPDDLLAIVLPASAYPLQLMDAARFLEELEGDDSLQPDPEWDDSVVALLNYPEVIELLNEDVDWTWRLGEAVVSQQGDVVSAIETFRDRAYAAGNLKSDSYQNVTRDEGIIEITPVVEDVIYVPYYEPERVVVYQPRPVYYYYPRSYPVYYYPYSAGYEFDRGFFWGVTTAFTIGWMSDSLNVYHSSYYGHPYYGRSYRDNYWYRRPTVNVYNTTYVRNTDVTINRYNRGDRWSPRTNRRDYSRDAYRTDYSRRSDTRRDSRQTQARLTDNREYKQRVVERKSASQPVRRQEPIEFRSRPERVDNSGQRPQRQARQQPRARAEQQHQPRQQARAQAVTQRHATQQPRARAEQQHQPRQQDREQAAPQRQARQQPREQAAPQLQARQQPREQAAPQRQARQQPREQAAPQRQEKREARGESQRSQKRQGDAGKQRNRKARR